ncbi:MAG: DUF805 domain-containing protein, partial [Actinomycetota bacterium]
KQQHWRESLRPARTTTSGLSGAPMSFVAAIQSGFRNYARFRGRASRSEFWWFSLFTLIVQLATSGSEVIGGLVSLALLLPGLAVHVRRLHDTDRRGWWVLWPALAFGTALGVFIVFAVSTAFDIINPDEWDPQTAFEGASGITLAIIGAALLAGIVTSVMNLVFLVQRSDVDANRFGPPPPPRSLPTGSVPA